MMLVPSQNAAKTRCRPARSASSPEPVVAFTLDLRNSSAATTTSLNLILHVQYSLGFAKIQNIRAVLIGLGWVVRLRGLDCLYFHFGSDAKVRVYDN